MNKLTDLKIQAIDIERLISQAAGDVLLVPQLQERLDDIRAEIDELCHIPGELITITDRPLIPRTAIFVNGLGVQDSSGIRPSLAGESLIAYERMFLEQALFDERKAARLAGRSRRKRGTPMPGLFFTGTPRGSFGLEFMPEVTGDQASLEIHTASLQNVGEAILKVGKAENLDEAMKSIPPRVLAAMRQFMLVMAKYGASIRLAFSNRPSLSLSEQEIEMAAVRLEREIEDRTVTERGTFQGLTFETLAFDLAIDGDVISGTVDENLSETDLERINGLTHSNCIATLLKTEIRYVDGTTTAYYVLLDAEPLT